MPWPRRSSTRAIDGIERPEAAVGLHRLGHHGHHGPESALKSREASRFAAEGFDVEYLLHGQAVPLDGRDRLVVLDPPGPRRCSGPWRRAAAGGRGRGLPIHEPADLHPLLAQIPLSVRGQMLALRLAEATGTDPDTVMVGPWADDATWRVGAPES